MPQTPGASAIVAFTSPLRLVFRDKHEKWAPTLDDINDGTYDYIKLHRLSASLEIGLPHPYCLHVGFDGSLLLPKIEQFWPVERAVSVFNDILGRLLLGGVYFDSVEPSDIDQAVLYPTGYYRPFGIAAGLMGQIKMGLQTKAASPLHSILLYEPKHIFSKEIHNGYRLGKDICAAIPALSTEFLILGVSAFISHDWAAALVNFWVSAEQIVEYLWRTNVIEGGPHPSLGITNRSDFLRDHRTWTTSIKLEVLFQKGVLPDVAYQKLSIARKARNRLVHDGSIPDHAESEAALEAVFQLIALVYKPDDIDFFAPTLDKYRQLDPINRHYTPPKTELIEQGAVWMGPLPPIPGENEWGDKPYENVYRLSSGDNKKPV